MASTSGATDEERSGEEMPVTGDRAMSKGVAPFEIEAAQCSVCGRNSPNEDFALFERNVGMCVADGIGGAPLGDAAARYACHVAMGILREGGTAYEAVDGAGESVRRFVTTIDSPGSGASLVVARVDGDSLDAAWAGDAAIFMLGDTGDNPPIMSNLQCDQPESAIPLCGGPRAQPGRITKALTDGESIVLCTDGTWRSVDRNTIGTLMLEGTSPREMVAQLVFGHQSDDDSTALVARFHKSGHALSVHRREGSHGHGNWYG